MDDEIMSTVESMFGKDVKIVDCQKKSTVQQEEVLLINGVPVRLDGIPNEDAHAIKSALLDGQMPALEHLNELLFRAGLAQKPIEVETSLTVKSSLVTTEEVMVSRNGHILDEKTIETKEHFNHQSQQKEIWQPIKQRATPDRLYNNEDNIRAIKLRDSSNSTIGGNTTENDNDERDTLNSGASVSSFGLNHSWSNATNNSTTATTTTMSSSSAITGSDSNVSTAATLGGKSINLSSYDSGHDDIFHSASQTAHCASRNDAGDDTLYCEVSSTADELDIKKLSTHTMHALDMDYGNLDALIERLFPASAAVHIVDEQLRIGFVLCARLLRQPHELLARIMEKYQYKWNDLRAAHMLHLLELWLRICSNDFRNNNFMQEVRTLCERCQQADNDLNEQIANLLQDIPEKLQTNDTKCKENEQFLETTRKQAILTSSSSGSLARQSSIKSLKQKITKSNSSDYSKSENVLSFGIGAKELAQQLGAIEHSYITLIRMEEFLDVYSKEELQYAICEDINDIQFKSQTKSNILNYLQWFQRLIKLVATEIVKLNKKSQPRAQLMDFWIETALECFNIGNFNSLMAILTGLNLKAIKRLKKTWSKLQTATKYNSLEQQMNAAENYSNYRATMKAAVWRSERDSANVEERAIIPYFQLFLKDLFKLNEQHAIKLPNEQLNFAQCNEFATQLQPFINLNSSNNYCPYIRNNQVMTHLLAAPIFNEMDLLYASFTCMQPETSVEKEHYKTLKAVKKLPKSEKI